MGPPHGVLSQQQYRVAQEYPLTGGPSGILCRQSLYRSVLNVSRSCIRQNFAGIWAARQLHPRGAVVVLRGAVVGLRGAVVVVFVMWYSSCRQLRPLYISFFLLQEQFSEFNKGWVSLCPGKNLENKTTTLKDMIDSPEVL